MGSCRLGAPTGRQGLAVIHSHVHTQYPRPRAARGELRMKAEGSPAGVGWGLQSGRGLLVEGMQQQWRPPGLSHVAPLLYLSGVFSLGAGFEGGLYVPMYPYVRASPHVGSQGACQVCQTLSRYSLRCKTKARPPKPAGEATQ